MPNRIIKESICTSASIDGLAWFDEVFFYRLIVNCDDYGRFDARPAVLRSRLFPLKEVTAKEVESALSKLVAAGMARVYQCKNQPYLQLESWGKHQSVRNKRSKYPEPPALEINCNQLHANVPVIQSVSLSESVSESESNPNSGGCGSNAREPNAFVDGPPEITVEAYIANELPRMSPGNIDQLRSLQDDGMQDDAIKMAVDIAAARNSRTWGFVYGILRKWAEANVWTAGDAKAAEDAFRAQKARAAPNQRPTQQPSKSQRFMEKAREMERRDTG